MRTCILCGKPHEIGTPCDFTGADSILSSRVTIPAACEDGIGKTEFIPITGTLKLKKAKHV